MKASHRGDKRPSDCRNVVFGTGMLVLGAVIVGDGKRLMPADSRQATSATRTRGDIAPL